MESYVWKGSKKRIAGRSFIFSLIKISAELFFNLTDVFINSAEKTDFNIFNKLELLYFIISSTFKKFNNPKAC